MHLSDAIEKQSSRICLTAFDGQEISTEAEKTLSLTVVEAVYRMTVDVSSYRESFNKDEARSIPDCAGV